MKAIKLVILCLTLFALTACTIKLTEQELAAKRARLMAQVLASVDYDNNPQQSTVLLKDQEGKDVTVYRAMKNGKVVGLAYEITEIGYDDDIRLILGVDGSGKVLGVRALEQHETWGHGDKIEMGKSYWILSFSGRSLDNPPLNQWKVRKSGGQFDEIAGATVTSRAVVDAVREGLKFFAANKTPLTQTP